MKKATATRAGNSSQRCLDAAFRYLDYRPRSEAELRRRLKRRGFDDEHVEAALASLREQGLVDDLAFAEFWKDNRESFRPRSRRLTALELRQKGVAEEVINRVVADIDDEDSAYRAAQGRAHRLADSDYREFRHRLGEYLKRRGFGYRVITNTVERLWQERKGGEKWE
jgi:regulatory protein